MREDWTPAIIIGTFAAVFFAAGLSLGIGFQGRVSEIKVLNGTAQYRLEEQSDNTTDWIKTTPYAIDCAPTEY